MVVLSEIWVDKKGWEDEGPDKMPQDFEQGSAGGEEEKQKEQSNGEDGDGNQEGITREGNQDSGGEEGSYSEKGEDWKEELESYRGLARGRMEGMLGKLERWVGNEGENIKTLIRGNCNAKKGKEGGGWQMGQKGGKGEGRKQSKDCRIDIEGKILVEFLKESGWIIFNDGIDGDEEKKFTFTRSRGCTMIDYVMGNEQVRGSETIETG